MGSPSHEPFIGSTKNLNQFAFGSSKIEKPEINNTGHGQTRLWARFFVARRHSARHDGSTADCSHREVRPPSLVPANRRFHPDARIRNRPTGLARWYLG